MAATTPEREMLEAFAFRKLVQHLQANPAAVQVSATGGLGSELAE
jgi:hypothetical protein